MATGTIKKIKEFPRWTMLVNDTTTANAVYDKTHTVSYPNSDKTEFMFSLQRVSNGRTFATTVIPADQFNGGAMYAGGNFGVSTTGNFINAVCIDSGNSQIEISVPSVNESIRVRFFVR